MPVYLLRADFVQESRAELHSNDIGTYAHLLSRLCLAAEGKVTAGEKLPFMWFFVAILLSDLKLAGRAMMRRVAVWMTVAALAIGIVIGGVSVHVVSAQSVTSQTGGSAAPEQESVLWETSHVCAAY